MKQETVLGLVLSAAPVGEYDKRLVILTKEYGKIAAFAKGARKPNSVLIACSQPFVFGKFSIYQGRTSYTVVSAEVQNYFEELRKDLEAAYYGFYFCELAEYLTRENVESVGMLKLLYQTLRVLTVKKIPVELVRYIYELKIFALNGESLQVFECINCGKKTKDFKEDARISIRRGGLVCESCMDKGDLETLNSSTVYTMQYIVATPVEKLYTFTVRSFVLKELERVLKKYFQTYVNHPFKSLEMLEIFGK